MFLTSAFVTKLKQLWNNKGSDFVCYCLVFVIISVKTLTKNFDLFSSTHVEH